MATNPPSLPRRQLSSITNTAQQQRGLPLSSSSASTAAAPGAGSPGSTKSKIATSTSTTTTASTTGTLVPGRRPQYPQYQHSTSSRLENPNNHYGASSLSHHSQYQQQQGVVAGSVAGSNTNSSSALRPPPPHHATRTSALQQQSRPVVQTRVHTTTHTTHTQTAAAISNTHTQAGVTTTVATTGVTGVTGTTGATGITDKPKSRKKDKPPRLPPPEIISDNNLMIQYVRGPSLGEGGFASCFLITDQSDNRYAAKVIQKTELQSHKTRQKLFAEIKIHQSLKHENIVRYHNCFEDEDFVYLVLELCESKTLMDLIKRRKRLTEPEVRYYMKELVEGCFYLHQQKTIHRDLKLGNLFLTHDMHVRIGDFGLAAVILNEERKKTICGTPNYIAPEILFDTDNGHSFEVDIWSVGVIMYTLLVGKPPFQTNEVKAIYKKIRDNDYVFPDDVPISKEAKDLIASLLSPTPSSRPSVGDVLSHNFFSSGYFPDVLERRTLHVPPNFEEEERLWRESFRLQHAGAAGSLDTADDDQDQKQHLDLEQMHLSDPPASSHPKHPSSSHPAKRYPGATSELTPLGKKPMQGQQHQPTPKQSVTPNKQQQQQQQQSTPLPDPPFQYGEQIKMELVDGDRVTSEIRTINMDRGRAAPSTQHRLQQQDQRKQNHLQQQQRQPATASSLVARNESSSTLDLQQTVKTERAARTTSSVQHSQSQTSMTRSGMVQPLSLSPSSLLESASGTNVPSSSTASVPTSSRLPVPKSRLNSGSPQQGGQQSSSTEYMASTPTRSSFTQTQTSPKPGSPMTTGSSTPSMSASQKSTIQGHPPLQLQKASSPSPTGMGKRHPSDSTAVVPGDSGSSAKSLSQSRRQESMLNRLTSAVDGPQSKFHRMATGLMDMDADFELEMDMEIDPRNGDPLAGNAFDAMRDHLDDELELEQLQKPRRTVGSLHGLSSSRTARSKTTVIQTVHGVERPASAMQKTYQQDGEPSDAQQATVSPRKSARVMQAQLTESPSPLVKRSSQNGLHSPQQQQQQQQRHQHSFLHTSQQGTQPPLETNHAPFAQLPRTPPSPTHRLSNRKSQQFTTDAFTSVQSHLHELSQEHERDLASPVFTHQQHQQQQQQHRRQHPVDLGLCEPDEPDILGEMVSSAVQGDVSMNDEDSSGSGKRHRRDLDVGTTVQKQSQRQQVQKLNRRDSMEDPQRPQLANSLQRRNQQVKQQQQQQQFASSQSLTGSLSMNNTNNNPNKQSNETTMGMSTGGHSDEQDQVEIPSTSCVTTTSMSLSMHHDQKQQQQQQQQQQPQQQAQDIQLKTLSGLQSERIQKRKSKKVTVIDPVSPDLHLRPVGACEAVENFLRAIICTRSEGVWISPNMEEPAPSHPAVFVTRWIDYERYGFGWQLSNGVVGVFYNDRTTLALSPNGIDIEVTESPHKRRRRHCSNPSNWLRTRSHSEQKRGVELSLRKNHWCGHDRKHPHPDSNSSNTLSTPQDTNNPRSMDALTAEFRAGLEYERRVDGDDEYPLMRIYDVKNNLVTSSTNRSASLMPGDNGSVTLGNGSMDNYGDEDGSIFPGMLQDQDFYDEWDYADYLETLDRTYCRMHSKEIPRLAKRIKVLEGFRNYMAHWLVSLSPWVYQDLSLTKGMPFLTDLYRRKEKKHVIARLSNGIVQVNFADHSKLIFSQDGEVVTLIDGDDISRRITMKTHQALSPEYFYDLEDEKDQEKIVIDELREIQCNMLQRRYGTSQNEFEENRPVFHSERDQDLTLFPRPYLRAKAAKQQVFSARIQKAQDLSQGSEHSEHREHDEQHEDKLTKLVSREYVVKGEDAVTAELKDIEKDDEALAILHTTLRDLHLQLVRRIRLALKLLVARRMENAQCRMKGRLENEHYLKDRDESRRRRASRKEKEQEEGKKKAKGKVDKDDEDVVKLEEEEDDREEGTEQVPDGYLLKCE